MILRLVGRANRDAVLYCEEGPVAMVLLKDIPPEHVAEATALSMRVTSACWDWWWARYGKSLPIPLRMQADLDMLGWPEKFARAFPGAKRISLPQDGRNPSKQCRAAL